MSATFTERLRTTPFLIEHVDGLTICEPLQFIPFAPTGEHGRADPLSSAPVTFDDRVHGSVDSNAAS